MSESKSDALRAEARQVLVRSFASEFTLPVIARAEGATITDVDGNLLFATTGASFSAFKPNNESGMTRTACTPAFTIVSNAASNSSGSRTSTI